MGGDFSNILPNLQRHGAVTGFMSPNSPIQFPPLLSVSTEKEEGHQHCFCTSLPHSTVPIKLDLKTNECAHISNCESSTNSNTVPTPVSTKKRKREMASSQSLQAETKMDNKLWSVDFTNQFIRIMLPVKVENGMWVGGRFSKEAWDKIFMLFRQETGKKYTALQLKGKYCRLRIDYLDMHWLIWHTSQTGAGWDPMNQTIRVTGSSWSVINNLRPGATRFENKGLPNYDLMVELFHDSSAQGTFARSSKQGPLTNEEEDELEALHQNIGCSTIHETNNLKDDENFEGTVGKQPHWSFNTSLGSKRKAETMSIDSKKEKFSKGSKDTVVEEQKQMTWAQWERESVSKEKKLDKQLELLENESRYAKQCSIPACIELLSEIEHLPMPLFNAMCKTFLDDNFLKLWISTTKEYREWIVFNKN